jgi:hypothetical protein
MDTIRIGAAAVTGARHLRAARNGQDAAATWIGAGAAAVVVCDGCGSGASSEVGARLGARLFARALGARLDRESLEDAFAAARADVARVLEELLEHMPGDRCELVREYFLFTIVAAAVKGSDAAVWALGDGAYALDGDVRVLGPFSDNEPPYLAYDLLGSPAAARFERTAARAIVIATDGAEDVPLARFASERFVTHPDALRRELALLARAPEKIDWAERRVVRAPAVVQDDCAIGVLLR